MKRSQLALQFKAQTGMTTQHALSVLWQGLREDPGSAAQTVMAANAPVSILNFKKMNPGSHTLLAILMA